MGLIHGGNIAAAAQRFGIPVHQWIDLSTGISPRSWSVPTVPASVWQSLPQADGELEQVAASYYGCKVEALLAVPGSQYALQYTPRHLPRGRVAIPQRGYEEHRSAWQDAGHGIIEYTDGAELQTLVQTGAVDHALLINPNNPTGEVVSREKVMALHQQLNTNGGYLVVDEAFTDASPECSVASYCPKAGLIVYRSLGKYFGLAGVRLGFMLAPEKLCREQGSLMPPWSLSHPARWIGALALADSAWHQEQSGYLLATSGEWLRMLRDTFPDLAFRATPLFASGVGDAKYCEAIYRALGRRGLLIRIFSADQGRNMLRFGLPPAAAQEQVIQYLKEVVEECSCAVI